MCRAEDSEIMGQQSQTNVFLILGNVALRQKKRKSTTTILLLHYWEGENAKIAKIAQRTDWVVFLKSCHGAQNSTVDRRMKSWQMGSVEPGITALSDEATLHCISVSQNDNSGREGVGRMDGNILGTVSFSQQGQKGIFAHDLSECTHQRLVLSQELCKTKCVTNLFSLSF